MNKNREVESNGVVEYHNASFVYPRCGPAWMTPPQVIRAIERDLLEYSPLFNYSLTKRLTQLRTLGRCLPVIGIVILSGLSAHIGGELGLAVALFSMIVLFLGLFIWDAISDNQTTILNEKSLLLWLHDLIYR